MFDKNKAIEKTADKKERLNNNIYKQTEIDKTAVHIWKKYATGDSESTLLKYALDNENLKIEDVCSGIKVCNYKEAIKTDDNSWIDEFGAVIRIYREMSDSVLSNIDNKSIAQISLLPFARYIQKRIAALYSSLLERISGEAVKEYSYFILGQLAFIAEDTLQTCARCFANSLEISFWRQRPVNEQGICFLSWFYSDGISQMFNTYPLVIKKLMNTVKRHYINFYSFISGFNRDIGLISKKFGVLPNGLIIKHLSGNLSDPHNGGKTVMRLELSSGDVIYYKPRSMAVDNAWARFTDRLNRSGFPTRLYAPEVLDMGSYGYMQEITYHSAVSEDEMKEYYTNAGGLCCVVAMLGGSDFHHENIIAHGTVPVLIDVETIITPKPAPLYGLTGVTQNEGASTHVGRTLMLQRWVGESPISARDIGGFTSEQITEKNIPDVKKGAEYYINEFISGYSRAYDFFLSRKHAILQEGWLNDFAGCQFRYVFRRTALYYSLIKHFYSAAFMRDILYFEGAISRFGAGILLNFDKTDAKKLWNLVLEEKEAARRGDIPYFTCSGSSKDIFVGKGVCVKEFFDSSPVELASHNLMLMTQENKLREIKYINLDLETCYLQKQFSDKTPVLSYQDSQRTVSSDLNAYEQKIIDEIKRLKKEIDSFELTGGQFDYYAPVRDRKNTRYNLEILPTDLYSGVLGVLSAQAAYAWLFDCKQLKLKLYEKIKKIYSEEYHTGRNSVLLNLSYTQGIAGFIQTIITIVDISDNKSLMEMAVNVALDIPEEHIRRTHEADFFGGLSGLLYFLSKLYMRCGNDKLKIKIELVSEELIKRAQTDEQGRLLWRTENEYAPLVGLAHGQSGIAIALLQSWNVIGCHRLYEIADRLFEYEKNCYSEKENNWYDFRRFQVDLRDYNKQETYSSRFMYGYCSGAPGIGISRLIASRLSGGEKYETDIKKVITFCENRSIIGNDSLCCGSCAWIDFMIEASLFYDDSKLLDHAKAICSATMPENSKQNYILSNLQGTSDISLFKGYSGIMYEFMRTLKPDKIPSIIL